MELEIIKKLLFISYKNYYFEKQIYDKKYGKICNIYSCNKYYNIINYRNIWNLNCLKIFVTNNLKYKYIHKTTHFFSLTKYINNKFDNYIYLFKDCYGYKKNKFYNHDKFSIINTNNYKSISYLNNKLIGYTYSSYYYISIKIKYIGLNINLLKIFTGNYKNLKLDKKIYNYKFILTI